MSAKKTNKHENLRVNVLISTFAVTLVIFVIRLFSIQILNHDKYTALAQDQYWNLSVVPAKRGDIISSDDVILAGTQTHYLMYAEPKEISNSFKTAHEIAEILTDLDSVRVQEENKIKLIAAEERLSEERFIQTQTHDKNAELTSSSIINIEPIAFDKDLVFKEHYDNALKSINTDLYWVVIKHNVTPLEKEQIEAKNIEGIGFEEEPVRYYPEKTLASHILGFVAYNDQGDKQGYFGIEGALDGDLRGKPGRTLEERDALGNPILIGGFKKSEPMEGRNIVLTINRAAQYIVEKKIKEGVEKYEAKSGSVIVMDPFTGEIIAMANYPTYQPDVFVYNEDENVDVKYPYRKQFERKNLSISQTYEPGSVLKPLTVSAAVELGKVTSDTTFNDQGPVQYSDYVIDNWDGKHHGVQTITQLLEKSNNIGAAWVGHLVGAKELSYFFREFGLGERLGIELEGEDTGTIRDYKSWTDIDLATVAFGQGVSATPLQVLNAFNVIANGGFLLQPKIISKIIDETEEIVLPTKQINRVLSQQTSDTMVEMLENAAHYGEATYFFKNIMSDYRVAGKTGTAQIPFEGEYDPEKTNATFAGFLVNSKKFSMIVKIEEPQTSIFAAETAVPLWLDIADELIKYYGIPPDKQ